MEMQASLVLAKCDLGALEGCSPLFRRMQSARMPVLANVLHASGVLQARHLQTSTETECLISLAAVHPQRLSSCTCTRQDALLAKQRPANMRDVFAPKVGGAGRLAASAAGAPVKASVMFSSIAGLLGSGGQANYAAANAALDAWASGHCSQVRITG